MIGLTVAIALSIGWIYLCGRIAEQHSRSIKLWLWLGTIFGPLALVLVRLLPPRRAEITNQ